MTCLQLLAAGSNAHGQLANETQDDSHELRYCVFAYEDGSLRKGLPGDRVVCVASGANHTLLLLECGPTPDKSQRELWGCGDGCHGQLGPSYLRGSTGRHQTSVFRRIDRDILAAVDVGQEAYIVTSIAASWESSYIVLRQQHGPQQDRKDIIISMGKNDFQDLGVPSKSKTSHGPHRVALESAFKTYVVTGFRVTGVVAATHHVVATIRLMSNQGEVDVLVGWGACRHGQLGTGVNVLATTAPRVISLAQTSSGVTRDTVTSFALGTHHTVLLHSSGHVAGFGSNKKDQLTGLQTQIGAKSVHCTWNGTYLVFENNTESQEWEIRATGSCDKGQLGHSPLSTVPVVPQVVQFPFDSTTHRLVRIACGSEHVLALFVVIREDTAEGGDTEVWGWGWNEHGNLGVGNINDAHLPIKIWPQCVQTSKPTRVLGIWAGCGTSWIAETH